MKAGGFCDNGPIVKTLRRMNDYGDDIRPCRTDSGTGPNS